MMDPVERNTCPYASSLLREATDASSSTATTLRPLLKSDSNELSSSSASRSAVSSSVITSKAIKACPAFSTSCPFKEASSAEQVQETLLKVPPSHFQRDSEFFQVIAGLHQVTEKLQSSTTSTNSTTTAASGTVVSTAFSVPGGCPVQSLLKNKKASFAEAMEELSLSAIMSVLTEQVEAKAQKRQLLTNLALSTSVPELEVAFTDNRDDSESVEFSSLASSSCPTATLSSALKAGTVVSHQAAEDVHFVKNFIRGRIDKHLYAQLVSMLYHVYVALEDCLAEHAPRFFGSCHFPAELERVTALIEDVEYWHGSIQRLPGASEATCDYINRIQFIADHNPLLLLAHAYTRYLGDLSGGKILARVARRAMHLRKEEGLAFYEFEHIESPKFFKDQYRAALDALPLTVTQISALVEEANVAFVLNMRLFEELDVQAQLPGATVRPLSEALSFGRVPPKKGNDSDSKLSPESNQCPFLFKKAPFSTNISSKSCASSVVMNFRSPKSLSAKNNQCPFQSQQLREDVILTSATTVKEKQCPWPFILLHDPVTGMRNYKTWVCVGLVLCAIWSMLLKQ